jgi:hypothetical protein
VLDLATGEPVPNELKNLLLTRRQILWRARGPFGKQRLA